jgi:hypothetical protein
MPHPGKQALFVLLSLADLALTCWLLARSGGQLYEANPVASWWLARHGAVGLACFKSAVVLLVLALVVVIARRRPCAAGRILSFGCASLVLVIGYSISLCRTALLTPQERRTAALAEANREIDTINRQTQAELRRREPARAFMAELRKGLLEGRINLREAANRLAASDMGRDPAWLRLLAVLHRDRPEAERIGAFVLLNFVGTEATQSEGARQVALRLEREFKLVFGSDPPSTVPPHLKARPPRPEGAPGRWPPRHHPWPPPPAGFGPRP